MFQSSFILHILSDLSEQFSKLGTTFFDKDDVTPNELFEAIKIFFRDPKRRPEQDKDEQALLNIRRVIAEEIEKFSPIRERTLQIPGAGNFELLKPLIGFKFRSRTSCLN